MKNILGKQYITDKEAANRYGYSQSWFRMKRKDNTGPHYVRFAKKGKVWYPLNETDKWFNDVMIVNR